MGMLRRKTPKNTSSLHTVLRTGSIAELEQHYSPSFVNYDGYPGATLLTTALGNSDPSSRVALAHRLLDDGADVTRHAPLHVLLGQNAHDPEPEAELLARLLDAGADVNHAVPDVGTPLETIAKKFKFSDADNQPFYDVLLARPDIDFLAPGLDGRPVLVNLRKWYALRGHLVEQVEAVLNRRGITAPPEPVDD
ncbi:hypothetical protein GCM10027270_20240 [Nocardioides ginkgobilobae]